jgi:hypothetical protein
VPKGKQRSDCRRTGENVASPGYWRTKASINVPSDLQDNATQRATALGTTYEYRHESILNSDRLPSPPLPPVPHRGKVAAPQLGRRDFRHWPSGAEHTSPYQDNAYFLGNLEAWDVGSARIFIKLHHCTSC